MLKELLRWWLDRPWCSKLALLAVATMFASQFFTYSTRNNTAMPSFGSNYSMTVTIWFDQSPEGTGWEIHKAAPILLMLLAAFHGSSIAESRHFLKFGYWLSLVMMFFCMVPGRIYTEGGRIGGIAWLMMLLATIMNLFRRPAAPPLPPAPTPPPPAV